MFRSSGKGGTLGNRLPARQVGTIVTCRCGRGNERISAGVRWRGCGTGGRKKGGGKPVIFPVGPWRILPRMPGIA